MKNYLVGSLTTPVVDEFYNIKWAQAALFKD